jgi:hypothetical protein
MTFPPKEVSVPSNCLLRPLPPFYENPVQISPGKELFEHGRPARAIKLRPISNEMAKMSNKPSSENRKQFLAAVTLAAIYGMDRLSLREYLRAGWNVLLAITARSKNLDPELGQRRLSHCEQCLLYYAPLSTCSSPLGDNPELGCWCHMPSKVNDPKATCWADENTEADSNIGWKSAGLDKP